MPHRWELVSNPGWAGQTPQHFKQSACHDHSHFLTVQCRCGEQMHMHESATRDLPADAGVMSVCKRCQRKMRFPPMCFAGAFAELRRQGWIV